MTQFKLNFPQVFFSLLGGGLTLSLLWAQSGNRSIFGFGITLFVVYWTVRLFYVMATPIDEEILLNTQTKNSLTKGICPLCNIEPLSTNTIKVGYKRGQYTDTKYYIIWIQWSHSFREIYSRIPICERCCIKYLKACSRKFFPKRMRNPSKILLRRKLGYRRGLVFPFETWNIKSSLDDKLAHNLALKTE